MSSAAQSGKFARAAAASGAPPSLDLPRTAAGWAEHVATDIPALLCDHAHLEFKAAASALSLLRRPGLPPQASLRLTALLREETEHAQRVLAVLHRRGEALRPDRNSPYAAGLLAAAGKPRRRRDGRSDTLLVAALIEARSHERFARLAACPALAELAPLYTSLGEAEERHAALFLELAAELDPPAELAERLTELAAAEATLLAQLPQDIRLHGGWPLQPGACGSRPAG